ncbi:hypothetical protein [Spirosoma sp.]|uniref:hypothetical protein n=1 Tax=Spirosoma sp. TaxID=1899569 RepID=UPI002604F838|nr:hypothetical protein [Spirosoma sp.]MCX6216368.1 hypothetical protein [Spirosoma sp.]
MINFNDYKNEFLKITLKDSEYADPIIGQVNAIGGVQPSTPGFTPNPSSCLFIKFADETHARQDDYAGSEIISLYGDDIDSIEVLKFD